MAEDGLGSEAILESLKRIASILIAGSHNDEVCHTALALRLTAKLRRQLTESIVDEFADYALGSFPDPRSRFPNPVEGRPAEIKGFIEVKIFCLLLMVMALINEGQYERALKVAVSGTLMLQCRDRRTIDHLSTRLFFYCSYSSELAGLHASTRLLLLDLYDIAIGRQSDDWQEAILHLLVRSYLLDNQYYQAEMLLCKVWKLKSYSNRQACCYHFYLGKIQTIQLKYAAAKAALQTALSRAPDVARGFRIQCTKWFTLACLLLGEIPKRTIFSQKGMVNALRPYLQLANAVRIGSLELLRTTTERFLDTFEADRTRNVVIRLRHSAIRAGLRNINISYSRISIADIARKLRLNSPDPVVEIENILAKAIRDGTIHATLDHSRGWMVSKESRDIYSTNEPRIAFNSRIALCFDIHNEAARAIVPVETDKEIEKRPREVTEEELAELIADHDSDYPF